jgi:hypothetical protein
MSLPPLTTAIVVSGNCSYANETVMIWPQRRDYFHIRVKQKGGCGIISHHRRPAIVATVRVAGFLRWR